MSLQTETTTTETAVPEVGIEWHFAPVNPARLARFFALPRAQRVELAEQFRMNKAEMFEWASCYRPEVPLVNGEFFFIALFMGDLDD